MQQQLHFDHESFTRPITSEDRNQFGTRNMKLAWITASITFFGLLLLLGPLMFFLAGMEPLLLVISFAIAFGIALVLLIALLLQAEETQVEVLLSKTAINLCIFLCLYLLPI